MEVGAFELPSSPTHTVAQDMADGAEIASTDDNVRVICRFRPQNASELERGATEQFIISEEGVSARTAVSPSTDFAHFILFRVEMLGTALYLIVSLTRMHSNVMFSNVSPISRFGMFLQVSMLPFLRTVKRAVERRTQ